MLKIVQQTVELTAPPSELYDMYLDAPTHAAFTGGGTVAIAPVTGTEWSAFEGRIHGRILALMPARQIVQPGVASSGRLGSLTPCSCWRSPRRTEARGWISHRSGCQSGSTKRSSAGGRCATGNLGRPTWSADDDSRGSRGSRPQHPELR
jgi:hypothetical protein